MRLLIPGTFVGLYLCALWLGESRLILASCGCLVVQCALGLWYSMRADAAPSERKTLQVLTVVSGATALAALLAPSAYRGILITISGWLCASVFMSMLRSPVRPSTPMDGRSER